ncbi:MAG: hypothetical protein V4712_08455 [Pseudomonadota bacterium]
MAAKTEIDVMLERLKALSDGYFETHPDKINWGDVGTLNTTPACCARLQPTNA